MMPWDASPAGDHFRPGLQTCASSLSCLSLFNPTRACPFLLVGDQKIVLFLYLLVVAVMWPAALHQLRWLCVAEHMLSHRRHQR